MTLITAVAVVHPPLAGAETVSFQTRTLARTADPVIVDGEDLPALIGKEPETIRLFSFQDGKARAIPFQIDQRDSGGDWVWDVSFDGGRTRDDQDPEGKKILDANDLLVFITRDAGDRQVAPRDSLRMEVVSEIEVEDPLDGGRGWVYAAYYPSNAPPPSKKRYMRFSPDKRQISAATYQIRYSLKHSAVLQELALGKQNVMDRLKVRGKAEIGIGFIKASMRFNEEKVTGHMAGYIDGPVRTFLRTVNSVRLPLGLKTPLVNCDHFYYPEHSEVPLLLPIRFLVHRATLRLTADYLGESFQHAYLDGAHKSQALGQRHPAGQPLEIDQSGRWIGVEGERGTVFQMAVLPETVRRHATVHVYLLEDPEAANTPEDVPGSEPEAGFEVRTKPGLPRGDHILYLIFFMTPDPYRPGLEKQVIRLLDHRVSYQIHDR
jgi:hypothetical protein